VLATVQTPEVIAFATRLAASSNMVERKYGFEMLQSVAPDASDTRSLVRRTLATEQSPEVLVQALATLQSPIAEPEEADAMVAQLKTLSQHADPAVRSLSLQQLGQWDKRGEGAEYLAQALMDSAPEVRQSAIFAIAQSGIRSDSVKLALMGLVNNLQESRDVRGSALQALERFSLSKAEYASFAQARAQLKGL
jgi:HEAT repeat protein